MNAAKWILIAIAFVVVGNLVVWGADEWLDGGCIVNIAGLCETPRK